MLHPFVVILILAVLSLPAFALFCWIAFDDLRASTGSIVPGVLKVLTLLLSMRLFAVFLAHDDDNSMFNVLVAVAAYILVIVGEYYWLSAAWPSLFSMDLRTAVLG